MTAQTSAGQNSIAQPSTAQKRPLATQNNNNTTEKKQSNANRQRNKQKHKDSNATRV